mmetsp:Transcript_13298/g.47722  ORF Transcript_13298/g.47722 Transcript_13298/m.47722 type:complete len:247 (+) Transcript_13298:1036-1776(+)
MDGAATRARAPRRRRARDRGDAGGGASVHDADGLPGPGFRAERVLAPRARDLDPRRVHRERRVEGVRAADRRRGAPEGGKVEDDDRRRRRLAAARGARRPRGDDQAKRRARVSARARRAMRPRVRERRVRADVWDLRAPHGRHRDRDHRRRVRGNVERPAQIVDGDQLCILAQVRGAHDHHRERAVRQRDAGGSRSDPRQRVDVGDRLNVPGGDARRRDGDAIVLRLLDPVGGDQIAAVVQRRRQG